MNRWFKADALMVERMNEAVNKTELPLSKIALRMGISRNSLYHYINGVSQMNMVNLRSFCIITNSNPAYILGMID